jgi:hypothetical protein
MVDAAAPDLPHDLLAFLDAKQETPSTALLSAQDAKDRLREIVEGFFFRGRRSDGRQRGSSGSSTLTRQCITRPLPGRSAQTSGSMSLPWEWDHELLLTPQGRGEKERAGDGPSRPNGLPWPRYPITTY